MNDVLATPTGGSPVDVYLALVAIILSLVTLGWQLAEWQQRRAIVRAWKTRVNVAHPHVLCDTTACPFPATDLCYSTRDGVSTSWRCYGCAAEGQAMGWWTFGDEAQGTDDPYRVDAQTKPPRIPEPGPWGVVEAAWEPSGERFTFVRTARQGDADWQVTEDGSLAFWSDLIDPVLVREGVES